VKGRLRINASGKNLYKFINALHSSRISCFSQYVRKDIFYAEIYRSDLARLEETAAKFDIELKYAEYDTLSSRIRRYRKRFGIIIGIIIVLVGSLYFSNVVVTIDIQGNSIVSDEVILAALAELDIKPGTPLRKINFHYCENELRVMVDQVSWAAIRHTGNRVVVEVTEIVEKPEMAVERIPCNIVSSKDAEITYTSVYDGFLMHKVGDYVLKGSLLVSGVTGDATGHTTLHHAMGEIRGIYEETVTFTGDYVTRTYEPTGESSNERYLRLFNLKIPLFFGKNKYKDSDCETYESSVNFLGKELPIGFVKDKITEKKLSEETLTDEELSEKLMEKIYLYEKNFFSGETEILERKITEEKTDTSLTYIVTYKLEGDICSQQDVFLK
jgi:putative stage IV sporulation yqfD